MIFDYWILLPCNWILLSYNSHPPLLLDQASLMILVWILYVWVPNTVSCINTLVQYVCAVWSMLQPLLHSAVCAYCTTRTAFTQLGGPCYHHHVPMRYIPIQSPASTSSLMSQLRVMSCDWPMVYWAALTASVERLCDVTRSVSLVERGRPARSSGTPFWKSTLGNCSGLKLCRIGSLERRRPWETRDGEAMMANPRIRFWYKF